MSGLEEFKITPTEFPVSAHLALMGSGLNLREALGGATMDITLAEQEKRIAYAIGLGLPDIGLFRDCAPPGARVLVCGSGPSIKASLPRIAKAKAEGAIIVAVNVTHELLIEEGIPPHFAVMLDPAERVAGYQTPTPGVRYLIGSNVHPAVWRRFRDHGIKPYMFIPVCTDTQGDTIMDRFPFANPVFVGGATTVGLRTLSIVQYMGFQEPEMHGFDSCYAPKGAGLYAVNKPHIHHDAREITLVSKTTGDKFTCVSNGAMSRQILGFQSLLSSADHTQVNGRIGGVRFRVAGDGAIPWMAWKDGGPHTLLEHVNPRAMFAKYGDNTHFNYAKDEPVYVN